MLASAAPVTGQVAGEVRGVVVDSATGAPIQRARIELLGTTAPVATGPEGRFVIRNVDPGERVLRIIALGYRPHSITLMVRNGTARVLWVGLVAAPVTVEDVVVRGSSGAASGVRVVDRAEIEASHARDLGELLEGQPGLLVIRTGGLGSVTNLSIRGSNADEVLVLLDGTPLNDPTTGAADLATVPLGTIEQVAIIKGAATARYGAGALAGVVVIDSRRAREADLGGILETGSFGELGLQARVGGGSRSDRWRVTGLGTAEYRRTNGNFTYLVPPVRGGGEATRANAQAEVLNSFASGTLASGDTELELRLEWLKVDRGMPGPVTQPTPSASQAQERMGGSATVGTRLGGWTVVADAGVRRQRTQYQDSAPPARGPYRDSVAVREETVRLEATSPWTSVTASWGLDYRHQQFQSSYLGDNAPNYVDFVSAWIMLRRELALGDNDRIELLGAVRVDGTSQTGGAFVSPVVGATWHRGRWAVHASWGRAFSPPSLADQFFQEGVLVEPNPNLGPERVEDDLQLGVSLAADAFGQLHLAGDITGYRSDIEGMILWLPDFRFIWSPRNFNVTRRGLDGSLIMTHRASGASIRASYSLTAVEYTGAVLSGQVAYRPRNAGSLGLALPYRRFKADLGARFVGDRRTVPGSAINSLPAYWMFDIGLAVRFTLGPWGSEAFLRVENVTNQSADLLPDYPLPSRTLRIGWRVNRT